MAKERTVSVLMPFKNTAAYLPDCLESIRAQYWPDWELLAVDDHSTDQSRAVLEEYAARDKRISVLSNKGTGIISALQKAFGESTGNLVSRMDSDDIMHPEKLSRMANTLLQEGPGCVAMGQVKYFSHQGISDGYARYEAWINGLIARGSNYEEIYKECVIPSPSWMVFREDLISVAAFDPERYPEDYDLTFRFYKKRLRCLPCQHILHYWRDYPGRTSRTSEHYARNYFLDIKLDYFLEIDHDPNRPLALWGAGYKGKALARRLLHHRIPFHWLCDNPKKIGKKIYGCELKPYTDLAAYASPQSVISVANTTAQASIRSYLLGLGLHSSDYFFFC